MDPHQTRLIRLLENGCEDTVMLQEAVASCLQNTEQRELRRPLVEGEDEADHDGTKPAQVGPLDFCVEASQNMTAMEISVLTQNTVAVEILLRGGAQPDLVSGLTCTSLCKVCYTFPGNIRMIRLLLEAGANPDATTNNDTSSASCLIISVVKDNVEAVKALLEYGADVSYEWKGQNALSMALDFKKDEIVLLLETHEYRRAQDNRWRRFTDRKQLEENRMLQRRALHKQIQLEDQRRNMLRHPHSKDPMAVPYDGKDSSPAHPTAGGDEEGSAAAASSPPHRLALPGAPQGNDDDGAASHPAHSDATTATTETAAPLSHSPQGAAAHAALEAANQSGIDASVVSNMSNMEWIIPREDLEIGEPISSGAHGDVFVGKLVSTDETVAVKRFPCTDAKSRECFRQEVTMLSRFRHENIVMFKGAIIAPDLCCMVSELCVENLLDRLARPGIITWAARLRWARDIAKSMIYLHSRTPQVVHRDLKSLNVLLDSNGCVKLCDFGMARYREHTYIATQHISGSPSWMAPEVLRGDDFDDKSDVYAFGVIMWELLTRKIPWPDKNMAQLVGLVGFGGHRLEVPNPLPERCPKGYVELMKLCWSNAPERPTFKTIRTQLDGMLREFE